LGLNFKKQEGFMVEDSEKTSLQGLEEELELIKRVHLKAIIEASKDPSRSIDDELLRQVSSYLRVVEKLVKVVYFQSKGWLRDSPGVKLVWEVLKEVPALKPYLYDRKVRAEIVKKIEERIKEDAEFGQS